MGELAALIASPGAWIALLTLVVMEVVLGVDNLVFVSIVHVPKGYIYAAMAFAGAVEGLNMAARKRRKTPPPGDRTLH